MRAMSTAGYVAVAVTLGSYFEVFPPWVEEIFELLAF